MYVLAMYVFVCKRLSGGYHKTDWLHTHKPNTRPNLVQDVLAVDSDIIE
jgi:hypothetical protein